MESQDDTCAVCGVDTAAHLDFTVRKQIGSSVTLGHETRVIPLAETLVVDDVIVCLACAEQIAQQLKASKEEAAETARAALVAENATTEEIV